MKIHSPQRLVYYSLFAGPWAAAATKQLLDSLASLRAHNTRIPVRVFVFGRLPLESVAAIEEHRAVVEDCGDYEAALARFCAPNVAETFARLPVLHYALSLARLDLPPSAQVLYLDSDTHFFRDVEELFDRYRELDIYAREEPYSRASHLGYDARLVDEEAIDALAASEGARRVVPFNNGVMIFNHGAWTKIAARLDELLRITFRFAVALALRPGSEKQSDVVYLRENRARLIGASDEAKALSCPTTNVWIKDEIAIWLTLGKVADLRVGLLSRHDSMQGDEFMRLDLPSHVLAHYFSLNGPRFAAWVSEHATTPAAAREPAAGEPTERVFAELGARIERAWQKVDFDEVAFPSLAATALEEARLEEKTTTLDVVRWLLGAPSIPQRDDLAAKFGDPPITVYRGRRFFIQVLLWREGSTAIHRHGFDGAFTVLDGSTLHVRHTFELRRRVSSRLAVGDLRIESAELLERGAVVGITWDMVHAAFHLESEAATVVVRTYTNDEAQPQYNYLLPGLAYDPFFVEPHATRQLQALGFLFRSCHAEAMPLAIDLARRTDLHTCWEVMRCAARAVGSAAAIAPLCAAARKRHGAVIDELACVLLEEQRRRMLGRLSSNVKDEGQRFFLALLQNLSDRATIEDLVRRRYPTGDARQRILAWLEALSGIDTIGVDLRDELNLHVVRALLDGQSATEVIESLKETFDPAQVDSDVAALMRHCTRTKATALAPLFR